MSKENKENIHAGHRQRLRSSYLKGNFDAFPDVTRLELLLFYAYPRRDTNPVAHKLLQEFGTLANVLDADYEQLIRIDGVTELAAALIPLMRQLQGVAQQQRAQERFMGILDSTKKCAEYFMPYFFGAHKEMVYCITLDGKCKVIKCRKLGEGSVNSTDISVRRIVEIALNDNSTSVVLAHNHPKGVVAPSADDEETTLRIWNALNTVGIQLIDHVVLCDTEYYSMADAGFFESFFR